MNMIMNVMTALNSANGSASDDPQTKCLKTMLDAIQKLNMDIVKQDAMINANPNDKQHIKVYKITNPKKKYVYYGWTKQKYLSAIPANLAKFRGKLANEPASYIQLELFDKQNPKSVRIELVDTLHTINSHTANDAVNKLNDTPISGWTIITQKKMKKDDDRVAVVCEEVDKVDKDDDDDDDDDDDSDDNDDDDSDDTDITPKSVIPNIKAKAKAKAVKATKDDVYCKCCNMNVSYKNYARHTKSKSHIKNAE
jgi:hypothetical protein